MPVSPSLTKGTSTFADAMTVNDIYTAVETIGQQVIENATAVNPLSDFDKGYLERGTVVEKICMELTASVAHDPNTAAVVPVDYPDVKVLYLNDWTAKDFYASVNDTEARAILAGENTLEAIATRTVSILSESEVAENFVDYKALFREFATNSEWHNEAQIITGVTGNIALIKQIRDLISAFRFTNATYSAAEYSHRTPMENIRIVLPYTVMNGLDIESYAYMFNMSKADLLAKIIETDEAPNEDGTYNVYVTDIRTFGKWMRNRSLMSDYSLPANAMTYKLNVYEMFAYVNLFKAACIKFTPATEALTDEV